MKSKQGVKEETKSNAAKVNEPIQSADEQTTPEQETAPETEQTIQLAGVKEETKSNIV